MPNRLDPDLTQHFVGLFWVQTVCISYQQTTQGDKRVNQQNKGMLIQENVEKKNIILNFY